MGGDFALARYRPAGSVHLVVVDVPPSLSVRGADLVEEGELYTLELAWNDADDEHITEWLVDWGDGSGVESIAAAASGSALTHTHSFLEGLKT